jgi:hypothetical protein
MLIIVLTWKKACGNTAHTFPKIQKIIADRILLTQPIGCHFLLAPPKNDVILDAMKIRGQTVYPLKERLNRLSKAMPSGCIEWQSTIRNGYGRLIIGSRTDGSRKSVSAHRLAYEVHVGEIPEGMFVCHICDNPKCINPEHLFVGTRQDNVDDRENKQRNKMPPIAKNEQAYFVKYTDDIINKIRQENGPSRLAAAKYGVSERYVRDIRNNKYRKLPEPPK